jgi:hypothetical protein
MNRNRDRDRTARQVILNFFQDVKSNFVYLSPY